MAITVERITFPAQMPKAIRVAAYARVSSGKDAMLHSLAAQVDIIALTSATTLAGNMRVFTPMKLRLAPRPAARTSNGCLQIAVPEKSTVF